jgi:hypothetical protein
LLKAPCIEVNPAKVICQHRKTGHNLSFQITPNNGSLSKKKPRKVKGINKERKWEKLTIMNCRKLVNAEVYGDGRIELYIHGRDKGGVITEKALKGIGVGTGPEGAPRDLHPRLTPGLEGDNYA